MRAHPIAFLALLFSLVLLHPLLTAQSREADLSARLVGKPLFLRGFWAEDKLKFDGAGVPQGRTTITSFTAAAISVSTVRIQGSSLHIEGLRQGLEFDEDGRMDRVTFKVGKLFKEKPEKIEIEVAGNGSQNFDTALKAIFADKLVDLIPSLPPFWQRYAQANFLAPADSDDDAGDVENPPAHPRKRSSVGEQGSMHVGGNVKAPKVTHQVNPEFTDYARRMKHSGTVELYLWVEKDGSISHVSVSKAAGLGLDEQAVAAVLKYSFDPARQNDQPVNVDLYIDVNFQIF